MTLLRRFKVHYHHSKLAALWHQHAPPLIFSRKCYGAKIFMDLRDNIDDLTRSTTELENREGLVLDLPRIVDGLIWDVGANIGLFAVRAATLDKPCVAFELSPKAAYLLEKTRNHNNLSFILVQQPMTVAPQKYNPPVSASAENKMECICDGKMTSISYQEAADRYGVPRLIKMDIEGGEESFFNSKEFKRWIVDNEILWLVEVHHRQIGYYPEWDDVPHCSIGEEHVLYTANKGLLNCIMQSLRTCAEIVK